jgi:ech hydrogenase subunit D
MNESQTYLSQPLDTLLAKVRELREHNWRLVQIGATPLGETLELNYSFDQGGKFVNLRVSLPAAGATVPSISGLYWCAFIYENEIHDLFKVQIEGIAVDYKGKFYRTTVPFPFSGRPFVAGVTPSGVVTRPAAAPATAPAPTTVVTAPAPKA